MRARLWFGVLFSLIGLLLPATSATAATGTETFRIVFTDDPHAGGVGTVIATGLVLARGTDRTIAQEFDQNGIETDTDLLTFPNGTITIRDTDAQTTFDFNPVTCTGQFTGNGPFTIVGSTGAYAGASGGGTFQAKGFVLFTRSGGQCGEEPIAFFAIVTATGSLSIPGL